jgi:hypothetical protein
MGLVGYPVDAVRYLLQLLRDYSPIFTNEILWRLRMFDDRLHAILGIQCQVVPCVIKSKY